MDVAKQPSAKEMRLVIGASSLGTVFEWYDFFIYGTLAAGIIGKAFFPPAIRWCRRCSPGRDSRSASASGRSARSCSAISATGWGANTPSSSRSR